MSVIASQLVGQVSIQGVEQAIGKLLTMSAATDEAGSKFALLAGGGIAIAGAALIGIGAKSVQMAGNFQQSLTQLVTGAGESAANIKQVGNGILDLAVQTGTSTKSLTDGMFMIESAGYHGSQGLNVLKIAAEGAKVGNADLGVVANAMTTYMQDYHVSANHAAEGMNWLTAVVSNGKTHLQDLAKSMSSILPLASAYGVKSSEVGGAIAVMTNAGMSAQNATHGLANSLRALEAPNAAASKSLLQVGLSSKQVVEDIKNKGLPDAIQLITDAVGKKFPAGSVEYNEAMKKIMGGATGLNVALMLGGKNMDAFRNATKSVADALKNGGDSVTGWSAVTGDFNFKMDQAKAVVETLGIKLGTALLPVVTQVMGFFTDTLVPGIGNAITYVQQVLQSLNLSDFKEAWHAIGVDVQQVIYMFNGLMQALNPFKGAVGDFDPLAEAIANLAKGGLQTVTNLMWALSGAFNEVMREMQTGTGVIGAIENIFKRLAPVFAQIGSLFVSNLVPAWHQLQAAMVPLMPALETIGKILGGVLVIAIGILIGALTGLAKGVAGAIGGIVTIITGLVQIFTGVFNTVGGIVMFIVDLCTGHFGKLKGDLGQIGTGIVQIFKGMWTIVQGIFQTAFGFIGGLVSGFVQGIVGYFTGLYETLVGHSIIPDMVNGIVRWIGQLPGRAMAFVQSLVSQMTATLGSLGSQALGWANDMISGFVSGIENGVGRIGSAVAGIASTIAAHLHFSKPDVGALANADTFMPDFMNLLAQGMDSNVAKVKAAADRVAASIGLSVNPNAHVTGASLTNQLAHVATGGSAQHGHSTHHHTSSTHHHATSTHHHAKSTHHHTGHSTHHHTGTSTHHHTGHSTHHHTGTSTHHYSASTYAGLGTAIASAFNQQPIKVEITLKSANQPIVLNVNNQQLAKTIMPLIVSEIRQKTGAKI